MRAFTLYPLLAKQPLGKVDGQPFGSAMAGANLPKIA